jgi:DNA polymerase III delta subunit
MADLKPAYLVWGDDDARIDSWRERVRARVESEGPDGTLEVFRDDRLTGESVAEALGALTLAPGERWVVADGIERWGEKDVAPVEQALTAMPAGTVAVLIAAGTKRGKGGDQPPVPASLVRAVERSGGEVRACTAPKGAGYSRWLVEHAGELGIQLDREAAQTLLAHVGRNQRRLLRELEKLAIYAGAGGTVDVEVVEALTAVTVEKKTVELADALVEGDRGRALRIAEELRSRGEDMMTILFRLHSRVSDCHRAWAKLTAGASAKEVEASLRMPGWLAKRVVAQAREADEAQLEQAIELLADLDWAIRGGTKLDADAALTLALATAGE